MRTSQSRPSQRRRRRQRKSRRRSPHFGSGCSTAPSRSSSSFFVVRSSSRQPTKNEQRGTKNDLLDETRIRLEAIHYVRDLRERWVAVPASELKQFPTGGESVFLRGQQGIFKPAELTDPLSITSTIDSPYTDDPIEGSRVLYDFLPV